jgi:hypothetical protein
MSLSRWHASPIATERGASPARLGARSPRRGQANTKSRSHRYGRHRVTADKYVRAAQGPFRVLWGRSYLLRRHLPVHRWWRLRDDAGSCCCDWRTWGSRTRSRCYGRCRAPTGTRTPKSSPSAISLGSCSGGSRGSGCGSTPSIGPGWPLCSTRYRNRACRACGCWYARTWCSAGTVTSSLAGTRRRHGRGGGAGRARPGRHDLGSRSPFAG